MNTPRDIVPEPDRRKIREDLLAEDNIRARINDMLVLARESDDYDMTAFAQARHEAAYIGGLI